MSIQLAPDAEATILRTMAEKLELDLADLRGLAAVLETAADGDLSLAAENGRAIIAERQQVALLWAIAELGGAVDRLSSEFENHHSMAIRERAAQRDAAPTLADLIENFVSIESNGEGIDEEDEASETALYQRHEDALKSLLTYRAATLDEARQKFAFLRDRVDAEIFSYRNNVSALLSSFESPPPCAPMPKMTKERTEPLNFVRTSSVDGFQAWQAFDRAHAPKPANATPSLEEQDRASAAVDETPEPNSDLDELAHLRLAIHDLCSLTSVLVACMAPIDLSGHNGPYVLAGDQGDALSFVANELQDRAVKLRDAYEERAGAALDARRRCIDAA